MKNKTIIRKAQSGCSFKDLGRGDFYCLLPSETANGLGTIFMIAEDIDKRKFCIDIQNGIVALVPSNNLKVYQVCPDGDLKFISCDYKFK